VLAHPRPAAAWCRATTKTKPLGPCSDDDGEPALRWKRGCVEYAFHPQFFERIAELEQYEVRDDFEEAFRAYADVDCGRLPFEVRQSQVTAYSEEAEFVWDLENESLIAMLSPEEWADHEYDDDVVAVTQLFFDPDSGEIYDVDMAFNGGAGSFDHCVGQCEDGRIDLRNTATHEAGHYLGLGHSTEPGSTMEPYGDRGETEKSTLEDDDRDGYCALDLPEPTNDDEECTAPIFSEFGEDAPRQVQAGPNCRAAPARRSSAGYLAPLLAAAAMLIGVRLQRGRRRRLSAR
jgi:Matrixin